MINLLDLILVVCLGLLLLNKLLHGQNVCLIVANLVLLLQQVFLGVVVIQHLFLGLELHVHLSHTVQQLVSLFAQELLLPTAIFHLRFQLLLDLVHAAKLVVNLVLHGDQPLLVQLDFSTQALVDMLLLGHFLVQLLPFEFQLL